jgi:hypothetical protein
MSPLASIVVLAWLAPAAPAPASPGAADPAAPVPVAPNAAPGDSSAPPSTAPSTLANPSAPPAEPPPAPAPAAPADAPPPERPIYFPPARPQPSDPSLPPPLPPPVRARRYADAGTSELSLALGYSSVSGFLAGGGFRRYVAAGVGPGVEASVQTGQGLTTGLVLASLRLVPLRGSGMALVVTGRAGRVLLSQHDDGWGAGGSAGLIFFLSPNVGLEAGYGVLWLLPRSFCADLTSCRIQSPELGLRVGF